MEQTKKPWYSSKIILIALTGLVTIGTNLVTGFITGQGVTPEQMEAVAQLQPAVADAIEKHQAGGGIIEAISGVFFAAIIFFRKWFTNALLV